MNYPIIYFFAIGSINLSDQITLAKERTGCDVLCITDGLASTGWCHIIDEGQSFSEAMNELGTRDNLWGPNDPLFEKICIARWFSILCWMERNNIDRCMSCDSDVVLMDNPFTSPHDNGGVMLSSNESGSYAASFGVVTINSLRLFCDVVRQELKTGVAMAALNDMAIWSMLVKQNIISASNMSRIIDGVAFDHNLGSLDVFEDDGNGYKHIEWIGGDPYATVVSTKEKVRLLNLHCWGAAEERLGDYIEKARTLWTSERSYATAITQEG